MTRQSNGIEKTIRSYDRSATAYARRWFESSVMHSLLERFLALLDLRRPVLDVGCGPGRDVRYFLERGVDAVGIDLSQGMLTQAKQLVPNGIFLRMDFRHLAFADRSFAGIWACASLVHLPRNELPPVLTDFARILDRGILFLGVKEGEGEEWENDAYGTPRLFVYYQIAELKRALERSGFEIITIIRDQEPSRSHPWINVYARVGWPSRKRGG